MWIEDMKGECIVEYVAEVMRVAIALTCSAFLSSAAYAEASQFLVNIKGSPYIAGNVAIGGPALQFASSDNGLVFSQIFGVRATEGKYKGIFLPRRGGYGCASGLEQPYGNPLRYCIRAIQMGANSWKVSYSSQARFKSSGPKDEVVREQVGFEITASGQYCSVHVSDYDHQDSKIHVNEISRVECRPAP